MKSLEQHIGGGGKTKRLGNNQPQLSDKVTWVHGPHTLSFGGNYIYLMSGQVQRSFINMGFPTLDAFAKDMPATLNSTFGTTGTELAEHLLWHQVGLFIQEDWRATPNLTLNLGLRYDNFGVFVDTARNARNVIQGPFDPFRDPHDLFDHNNDFGRASLCLKRYQEDHLYCEAASGCSMART
jgi:outer membrane receptor protein involved in Fe transport